MLLADRPEIEGLPLDLTLEVMELADEEDLLIVRDPLGVFLRAVCSLSASLASLIVAASPSRRRGAMFSLLLSSRLSAGSMSELQPPYLELKEEEAPSSSSDDSEPSAALDLRGPKDVPRRVREGAEEVVGVEGAFALLLDLLLEEFEIDRVLDIGVEGLALRIEGEETVRFIEAARPLRSREMAEELLGSSCSPAVDLVRRCLGVEGSSKDVCSLWSRHPLEWECCTRCCLARVRVIVVVVGSRGLELWRNSCSSCF